MGKEGYKIDPEILVVNNFYQLQLSCNLEHFLEIYGQKLHNQVRINENCFHSAMTVILPLKHNKAQKKSFLKIVP